MKREEFDCSICEYSDSCFAESVMHGFIVPGSLFCHKFRLSCEFKNLQKALLLAIQNSLVFILILFISVYASFFAVYLIFKYIIL